MIRRSPSILVVDDDGLHAELIANALRRSWHEPIIHIARNGEQALDIVGSDAPVDLVTLDVNLPGLSGLETLSAIRALSDGGGLPVVMLTSSARSVDRDRAYAAGANAYVVKPGDFAALVRLAAALNTIWGAADG
jgi:CheY-like chemotaxis protein